MRFVESFFFYNLILLPFALISGPFLPDLIISVNAFLFIFLSIKKKIFKNFFFNKISLFFFIWFFYLLLRSLFSQYPELSLSSSLFYLRFYIYSLVVLYLCLTNKKTIKYFSISLFIAFTILIIDGFFQFIYGYNLIGLPSHGDRVSSFFGEEKILGSYLSRLIPILFGLFVLIYERKKFFVYFLIFLLFSVDVLVYISGDRSAFLNLIIFTLLVIFLIKKFYLIRILTFISSIIFLIFLSINFDNLRERMINKTIQEIKVVKKSNNDINNIEDFINQKFSFNYFTVAHTKIYLTAINIFNDNKLFGTGTKTFRVVCTHKEYIFYEGCQSHPHNTYLQLLSETGFIGALPIIFIFFLITFTFFKILYLRIFFKKNIYSDFSIYMLIAIFITLWPIIPSGNFFNNWLSIIYYMPIGFLFYANRAKINFINVK